MQVHATLYIHIHAYTYVCVCARARTHVCIHTYVCVCLFSISVCIEIEEDQSSFCHPPLVFEQDERDCYHNFFFSLFIFVKKDDVFFFPKGLSVA